MVSRIWVVATILAATAMTVRAQPAPDQDARRLALAKVWIEVKVSHPAVARGQVDPDAAMPAAIAKVDAATTKETELALVDHRRVVGTAGLGVTACTRDPRREVMDTSLASVILDKYPRKRKSMQPIVIVPGYGGSGPQHWQSFWERELPHSRRIQVADWDAPRRADWLHALDDAIRTADAPPILIAHSLGCVAVAYWAASASHAIRGALLVAPPDLDRVSCPEVLRDFSPIPRNRLPFASHVIASDDDPYATLERARQMADDWGAQITILHRAGHINVDAGFGPWRDGHRWIDAIAHAPAASASKSTRDFAGV